MTEVTTSDLSVAIIGMACRFPGARDVREFWRNLRNGIDSIRHFSREEMESFGVSPEALDSPEFVCAAPVIEDADAFDAEFFGYPPKEAAWMDPQHRVFLECAWKALESAGYRPDHCPLPCGVYAGTSISSYLLYNLIPHLRDPHSEDSLQTMIGNDKDFLSTRVSYKLNLRGPSLDVQTGCSTSLVAVHLACQGLLNYHCDVALAGGVSVHTPQRHGYLYQKGGLTSPDGRCRAFDANAEGTVFGSGAGIVVLKRHADALRDGDSIIALIRGSAVNNDGSDKLGFTAPSIFGQTEVIRAAQLAADVEARSIGYVECHGTATPLGDPAEITALTDAFRATTADNNYCAIGSVKTNIGHLDAAAGVAGLIKTALALQHRELPPSLHFEHPNPQIDFASTPFFVNSELRQWPASQTPRRAGVSSFGIGGTNAHVVLEESPVAGSLPSLRTKHILCLSARTTTSLEVASSALADVLFEEQSLNLADVAYTLHRGRNACPLRRAIVCSGHADAVAALRRDSGSWCITSKASAAPRKIVFMFPGGGSQYLHMGEGLYRTEARFRAEVDRCCEILQRWLHCDLRTHVFPDQNSAEATKRIRQTGLGLPALFTIEYALAQLWMEWGLQPSALIGHSLGEYTAACISGVLSLEDALRMVAIRSRLMEHMSPGKMLSVPLPAPELEPMIDGVLSIAAINSAGSTVVSGDPGAIDALVGALEEKGIESRTLQIAVASHSPLVDSILPEFRDSIASLAMNPPRIPYISNLTGGWVTPELVMDSTYWTRHLRQCVLFHQGVQVLLKDSPSVFLEVGPGNALSTLVQPSPGTEIPDIVVPSMKHPYDPDSDETLLHRAAARLWACGAVNDWSQLYAGESRMRVPLPTYAFDKRRHWIDAPREGDLPSYAFATRKANPRSWVYMPGWKATPGTGVGKGTESGQRRWMVFLSNDPRCQELADQLREAIRDLIVVEQGSRYVQYSEGHFAIRPQERGDYKELLSAAFGFAEPEFLTIVHMWAVTPDEMVIDERKLLYYMTQTAIVSLGLVSGTLVQQLPGCVVDMAVVSDRTFEIGPGEDAIIEKSLLLGASRVIPQEHPKIRCRFIDVGDSRSVWREHTPQNLSSELLSEAPLPVVALRTGRRWIPDYPRIQLSDPDTASLLKEDGVYLLLGGTGEVGVELARALFSHKKARLIIASRHNFPAQSDWDASLTSGASGFGTSALNAFHQLRQEGAQLLFVNVDVADADSLRRAFETGSRHFGAIHGVFHLAGVTGPDAVHLASDANPDQVLIVANAKVSGIQHLRGLTNDYPVDFVALFSSTASVLGGVGLSSYAAANAVTEIAAVREDNRSESTRWISIAWDAWLTQRYAGQSALPPALREFAVNPEQALKLLLELLDGGRSGPFIVSSGDMSARYRKSLELEMPSQGGDRGPLDTENAGRPRASDYVPPVNDLEKMIAESWQSHLGLSCIGRDDRFFELGGNSLLALRIASDLKRRLHKDVSAISIFEGVSVRGMAEKLSMPTRAEERLEQSRTRGLERRHQNVPDNDETLLAR